MSLVSIPPKGDNELRFGWPAVQARRADGLLRHFVYEGLREDKPAREVRRTA